MMRWTPGSRRVAVYAIVLAVALTTTGLGMAAGLGLQILKGAGETGQGSQVSEQGLAYWGWASTVIGAVPAPVPAAVSHAVATPTRLPRLLGTSYTLNAGVAGQTAVVWTFTEATTAPRSTEFVITFVDGVGGATSTILAYLETGARAVPAALTFSFYWDSGAIAPAGLEISSMTATVQVCSAVGVCP
jgi:hypothetical protein